MSLGASVPIKPLPFEVPVTGRIREGSYLAILRTRGVDSRLFHQPAQHFLRPNDADQTSIFLALNHRKPVDIVRIHRVAGKSLKIALVAAMRKLLTILNAMVHHGTRWHSTAGVAA